MNRGRFERFRLILQLLKGGDSATIVDAIDLHILNQSGFFESSIVFLPEARHYRWKSIVFFLHLLVVTAALLGLSGAHKLFHGLENLVHASHLTVHEVLIMDLEKPMIPLVFFGEPMASVEVEVVHVAFCPAASG